MRGGFAILRRMFLKLLSGFVGGGTRDDVVGEVALMLFRVFLVLVLEKQATIVSPPSDGPDRRRSGRWAAEDARYRSCSSRRSRDRTKAC